MNGFFRRLLLLTSLTAPLLASAQVKAPDLIEEDLPAEEAPVAAPEPAPRPAAPLLRRAPSLPPVDAVPSVVRPIEPVRATFDDLVLAWQERRDALREQDVARARQAEARLLDLRRELAIANLDAMAIAEARAARRALEARAPTEAVSRAELAVALAPDLATARLALAQARFTLSPWRQGRAAVGDLVDAASVAWREPHTRRALLGDLGVAALSAAFVTGVLLLALFLVRHLRLMLHDAQHVPGLRLATPPQAAVLALAVLALPWLLRLGPAAVLATLALLSAPFLLRAERGVATVALLAIAAVPWGASRVAAATAFTGTLAEDVHTLLQGADDGRIAGRLGARAVKGDLPPAALVALGLHYKRRGDLASALRWYAAAGGERPDALVDTANVRFLQGDLENARAVYLKAVDRAIATGQVRPLAAAHYGLSKVFLRGLALDQAQEARRKATLEDPDLLERQGSDEDFRANRWLIDVPPPDAEVEALAMDDAPQAVGEALQARLSGAFPPASGPWLLFAAALLLWQVALLRRVLSPSTACVRCGGPACARCGPAASGQCGQCVNAFTRKGLVDVRDRLRKHAQVHRRERARRIAARALAVVSGGAGHVWAGAPARGGLVLLALAYLVFVAIFWRGAVPPPQPTGWEETAKLVLTVPIGLAIWAVAVRDLFRLTRKADPVALTGTLEDFGIAEILQLIGQQAKSGVLHLARGSEDIRITLADGCVVAAEDARRAQRDRLGEILVRAELLGREALDSALEVQRRTLRRLGDILVERRLITTSDLRDMTALQTTETVYRLFDWKNGTYRFEASAVDWDPSSASPLRAESILMEGFRRVDEWPLIRRKITSSAMSFRRLVDLADPAHQSEEAALSAHARRVFALVEPGRTLERITGVSRIGEFETSKALLDLLNLRLVEAVPPPRRAAASVGAYARSWAERLKRGAVGVAVTLALALALSTLAWLASERGLTLEEGGGTVLRDHAAQRFLARYQMARLRCGLEVYRLEMGTYPDALGGLVVAGLADRADLRYPFREEYYYRRGGDGSVVLLPPLP